LGDASQETRTAENAVPGATGTTANEGGKRARSRSERFAVGASVGRYEVVEFLGEGGMGVVYRARDPQLGRDVALKVFRRSAGKSAQTRLLREAQALAQLSHPNVVSVHDVGSVEGAVFIAMELVDGVELKQWLRSDKRDWREIVRVFAAAGRGLAAAHARGLVHRDFKPANVIVGHDGRVRVLDFGLARAAGGTDADFDSQTGGAPADSSDSSDSSGSSGSSGSDDAEPRTGDSALTPGRGRGLGATETPVDESQSDRPQLLSTPLTLLGAAIGTPRYMAPEQHAGGDVTPAADQFSFCVSLYEALGADRVFAGDTLKQYKANLLNGRVVDLPAESDAPRWLVAAARRGLAVYPDDRWPTMEALLQELSRERTAKKKAGLVAIAVGLIAGTAAIASGVSNDKCTGAAAAWGQTWTDARRAAIEDAFVAAGQVRADAIVTRLDQQVQSYGDRWRNAHQQTCEATHVRGDQSEAMMDARMACLRRSKGRLNALLDIFQTSATIPLSDRAGTAVSALDNLSECGDADVTEQEPLPPETRAAVDGVKTLLDEAVVQVAAGDYDAGVKANQQALARARNLGREPLLAQALISMSRAYEEKGDIDLSIETSEEAYVLASKIGNDRAAADAAMRVAWLLAFWQRAHEQALAHRVWIEGALARVNNPPGLMAQHHKARGVALNGIGKPVEALEAFELALDWAKKHETTDKLLLANYYNSVGTQHQALTQYREGREYIEKTLAIYEQTLDPDHPALSTPLTNLGNLATQMFDLDTAKSSLARALELDRAALGADHIWVAQSEFNLAQALAQGRELAEALPLLDSAALKIAGARGENHYEYAQALAQRAQRRIEAGQLQLARADVDSAVRIGSAALAANHPIVLEIRAVEANLLRAEGRCQDALSLYEQALASESLRGVGKAPLLTAMARCQRTAGRADAAVETARRAVAIFDGMGSEMDRLAAEPRFLLAELLAARRPEELELAQRLASQARRAYESLGPRWHSEVQAVRAWQARRGRPRVPDPLD